MMRRIVIAGAAVTLMGCASTTPKDLESLGKFLDAGIAGDPALVYRRLTIGTRECFSDRSLIVEADYFPDAREGRVSVNVQRINRSLATALVRPGPEGTKLTIHYATGGLSGEGWRDIATSMAGWARGEPAQCPPPWGKPVIGK